MMSRIKDIKKLIREQSNSSDELNVRRKKLLQLRRKGNAFPNDFRRKNISNQLYKQYLYTSNIELKKLNITVSVAGRIVSRRVMGKASFIILKDMGGCIQLYITVDSFVEKALYEENMKQWDLGDIIGAHGTLFKTRTEQLSVYCTTIKLLTKALRPLPDKFRGLHDQETKYRKRYLDLITNDATRKIFEMRSLIIFNIRQFMVARGFMEVETPMMHMIAGGAIAKPFTTYHNKLRTKMHLRIAPELYLKQLVIGGFEQIFEINRNFRNEGISTHHNPEFTMMEIYMAYVNYHDIIILIQDLFRVLTQQAFGKNVIRYGDNILDFGSPFVKMTIKEAIVHYLPHVTYQEIDNIDVIVSIAQSLGVKLSDHYTLNRMHMEIFESVIVPKIIQPTCIVSYPIELSTLARRNDNDPMLADRFEIFVAGQEIGNGFSELNDPEDQKERFLKQVQEKNIDITNNQCNIINYDEDYLIALEHGLPPTAGVGIGIDRLMMLFTNQHTIRDVILFPTLRPKENIL